MIHKVKNLSSSIRIDKYLIEVLSDLSRSEIQSLIKNEMITVDNKSIKPNYLLANDMIINIDLEKEEKIELKAKNLNLDIVYEDEDIAIINKDVDIIVHPSDKNEEDTLVNGLLYSIDKLSNAGEDFRPGIVHRLDKDTSGLMVIAKTDKAYYNLVEQFSTGKVKRYYLAVLRGEMEVANGEIDKPIGRDRKNRTKMSVNSVNGKRAITKYNLIFKNNGYSLVELELLTGRMHQIRVHMADNGNPVVGDSKYSNNKEKIDKQLLHAYKIGLNHPVTNEYIEFETDKPNRIKKYLKEVLDYEC